MWHESLCTFGRADIISYLNCIYSETKRVEPKHVQLAREFMYKWLGSLCTFGMTNYVQLVIDCRGPLSVDNAPPLAPFRTLNHGHLPPPH